MTPGCPEEAQPLHPSTFTAHSALALGGIPVVMSSRKQGKEPGECDSPKWLWSKVLRSLFAGLMELCIHPSTHRLTAPTGHDTITHTSISHPQDLPGPGKTQHHLTPTCPDVLVEEIPKTGCYMPDNKYIQWSL